MSQTQTSTEKNFFIEVPPLSTIVDSALLDFFIGGNGEDYIELNNTLLYFCCKIVKADRPNLRAGEAVVLMNNPLASISANGGLTNKPEQQLLPLLCFH